MKIDHATLGIMRTAIKAIVEVYKKTPQKFAELQAFYANKQLGCIWALWNVASFQLRNDDTHPAFQSGQQTRVIPYTGFDIYKVPGINDAHIQTALKKIVGELLSEP